MLVSFIRTAIIYLLLILSMRIMGKRQLGDLQPGELVITIIVSDLASIPITDPQAPMLYGIIPLATLILCELILSAVNLKRLKFRRALLGSPKLVIGNGRVLEKELSALRLTLDDLLGEVRNTGCASFAEVAYAILETDGKLSVIPKDPCNPPPKELPRMIISDGKLIENELTAAELKKNEVDAALKKRSLSVKRVFYCFYCDGEFEIVEKEKK